MMTRTSSATTFYHAKIQQSSTRLTGKHNSPMNLLQQTHRGQGGEKTGIISCTVWTVTRYVSWLATRWPWKITALWYGNSVRGFWCLTSRWKCRWFNFIICLQLVMWCHSKGITDSIRNYSVTDAFTAWNSCVCARMSQWPWGMEIVGCGSASMLAV